MIHPNTKRARVTLFKVFGAGGNQFGRREQSRGGRCGDDGESSGIIKHRYVVSGIEIDGDKGGYVQIEDEKIETIATY